MRFEAQSIFAVRIAALESSRLESIARNVKDSLDNDDSVRLCGKDHPVDFGIDVPTADYTTDSLSAKQVGRSQQRADWKRAGRFRFEVPKRKQQSHAFFDVAFRYFDH